MTSLSNRSKRFIGVLVVATMATAGFDRFDLFRGTGNFTFTPSILLCAAAGLTWVYLKLAKRLPPSRSSRTRVAAILALCLILIAAFSVAMSGFGSTSVRRFLLLTLLVVGTWTMLDIAAKLDMSVELRLGAWLGLALTLAMVLIQYITWSSVGPGIEIWIGPINAMSPTHGNFAPRPSGISLDPNRGSLHAAFFAYVIAADPWTRKKHASLAPWGALALSGLAVAASGSRSGLAVWLPIAAIIVWRISKKSGQKRALLGYSVGFVALFAMVAGALLAFLPGVGIGRYISERLNFSPDASGGIHLELYRLAGEAIVQRPGILANGIGFGNAPQLLKSVFGDKSGANFHSMYASATIETGLVGLIVILGILALPLRFRGRRTLALVLLVFNVFYQANLDAAFWIEVGFLWLLPFASTSEEEESRFVQADQDLPTVSRPPGAR